MKFIKTGTEMVTLGFALLFITIILFVDSKVAHSAMANNTPPAKKGLEAEAYGKLPLSFEANQGQTDHRVKFLSRGRGYALFLAGDEAVLSVKAADRPKKSTSTSGIAALNDATHSDANWNVLRVRLQGANRNPAVTGIDQLPSKVNYFVGKDVNQWRTNVPTYAKVKYAEVYPGIDLLYHGSTRQQLEYDFVVAPGGDPEAIELAFAGVESVQIDSQGNLVIKLDSGEVSELAPLIYQEIDGRRRRVSGGYQLKGKNRVGFKLTAYDSQKPLIIDPTLSYSTYLGGSGVDRARGVAVDSQGDAYITGSTDSTDFPTTPGAFQTQGGGAFVTKLNADGSQLVYSTYVSGAQGLGIAIDSSGNAYITGFAFASVGFPTTPGAFQTQGRGAFVTKLNVDGSQLLYSTIVGGGSEAVATAIAVNSQGDAYITGYTISDNFPITPGALQTKFGGSSDAFVTKLNADGSQLLFSTFLGGSSSDGGAGIAVDSSGHAYVSGSTLSADFPTTPGAFQTKASGANDAFVAELNLEGSQLVYSTFLGGFGNDAGAGIAIDGSGNAYVTGITGSENFPTTQGAFQTSKAGDFDAFVTKLNRDGSQLLYSTFLGGIGFDDSGLGIAVDRRGNACVTGSTDSVDFPTTPDAFQVNFAGDFSVTDAFMSKLNASGTELIYSTFLGGFGGGFGNDAGAGVAVDSQGNAYITGSTESTDFPTTPGAFQTNSAGGIVDAFVAKFQFEAPFAGQPGKPNCHGKSVSALDHEFGSLKAAASDLGFSSVKALQSAIRAFCKG